MFERRKEPPKVLPDDDVDDDIIGDDDAFVVVDLTSGVVVSKTAVHAEAFDLMRSYNAVHGAHTVVCRVVARME